MAAAEADEAHARAEAEKRAHESEARAAADAVARALLGAGPDGAPLPAAEVEYVPADPRAAMPLVENPEWLSAVVRLLEPCSAWRGSRAC